VEWASLIKLCAAAGHCGRPGYTLSQGAALPACLLSLHPRIAARTRRQFRLLLQRSWRQISRDKAATSARLMSNLSSAVIFGAIFFRMQVWCD
jgi:hypothetical protein